METARKSTVQLTYISKDITKSVKPYLMSLTYTDYEAGQSDELEIVFDDKDGRWQSNWYPTKGDIIKAKIGYEGEPLLNCGAFEIDEITSAFAPDTVTIKGLATNIKKPLRQKNTVAYENKTLIDIAKIIGKKQGFKVAGSEGFLKVNRATQKQETDLAFLKRLADEYGYIFKIANDILVFYKIKTLESKKSIFTLDKSDLAPGTQFTDKTNGTYSACTVQYFHSKQKKLHKVTVKSDNIVKGDTLKIKTRCESKTQAQLKANAALTKANTSTVEGSLNIEGNIKAIAGINFKLTNAKKFEGTYHIKQSRHSVIPDQGYSCSIDVKKVG